MVRVCCACGAQDKALKLVAEAQVPSPWDSRGSDSFKCLILSNFVIAKGRQAALANPFRSAAPGTPVRVTLGSLGVLRFRVAGAIHAFILYIHISKYYYHFVPPA